MFFFLKTKLFIFDFPLPYLITGGYTEQNAGLNWTPYGKYLTGIGNFSSDNGHEMELIIPNKVTSNPLSVVS